MIAIGGLAPDFTAPDEHGTPLTLSSFRGHPAVLFFFPKANSMGCTVETRAFAERFAEFRAAGWTVIGVSVDPVAEQAKFASKCRAEFPLVSDGDRSIARAYGVLGFLGMARRVTFLLDADGKVQEVVNAITPTVHVTRTLERLRAPTAK
ncbi:peroxiredoxin [mine drainage metagenome]|uniref:thioredoxin-dependent peroxiredoxin n=1 Tax=mine drainage metagenome TaxID=410659 RepID=T0XX05_9ZZZZ